MKTREIYLVLGSVLVVVAVLFMLNVIQLPSSETENETTYVTTNRPWYGPPHGPPFRVRAGIGPWPSPHHPHGPHPHPHPGPPPGHSIPTHVVIP
tara:strand:- start:200 stop:484 length:285 start_codon:yes stop_codon:yes gene_type:complete